MTSRQQKRQDRRTTLPHTPDGTPAPHLHSSKLFVAGNASATANNMPRTRRFSASASSAICSPRPWPSFSHWPLPAVQGVDQDLARLVVILGALMVTPIYSSTPSMTHCTLSRPWADFLSAFDKPQRRRLVMVFLRMHGQGYLRTRYLGTLAVPFACWCTGRRFFRASSAFGYAQRFPIWLRASPG